MTIPEVMAILEARVIERGLSRSDLARELCVHRSTVSCFFNRDRVDIRLGDLLRYMSVLDLELTIS